MGNAIPRLPIFVFMQSHLPATAPQLVRTGPLCQNVRMAIPALRNGSFQRLLVTLLMAFLLATPSRAQAPGQEAGEEPLFQVDVEVVTVPVTVTGRDDLFVTDLNPTDFRILDNGKEQRIENFDLSF